MKKTIFLVSAFVFALTSICFADIPKLINYQGMLTNISGEPLNGTFDTFFRIFNAPSGGDKRWEENHAALSVSQGLFNVILGSQSGGIHLDFSEEYWLEVVVEGEVMPRIEFVSVGYAYRALVADSASVAVSVPSAGGWTDDGSVVRLTDGDDFVCIGTTAPSGKLTVDGGDAMIKGGDGWDGSGDEASLFLGDNNHGFSAVYGQGARIWTFDGADHTIGFGGHTGTDYMTIKMNSGRVGIGTTSPGQLLHVYGASNPRILVEAPTDATPELNLKRGTNSYNMFLSSENKLMFFKDGTKVTFTPDGDVGIGTSSPVSRLHVVSTHQGNDSLGIYGESNFLAGYGVYGKSTNSGDGVHGYSGSGHGVVGKGWYGVWGHSEQGYGVYGSVTIGNGVTGLADSGYAGKFIGDVDITGTLTGGKGHFRVDHPLNPEHKYLSHSFVGSPDVKNVYDGVALLDASGEAWVELPDWFEALNRDFRYQLTAIGEPGPNLYIAQEISGNRFQVSGGSPGTKVSWQVTGIRQDPYAEKNRIPVEEEKPAQERGKYLHPEAYDLPETMGINYSDKKKLVR